MERHATDQELGTEAQTGEVVLTVEGLSKKFCRSLKRSLLYGVTDIATDLVVGRRKSAVLRRGEFWALDNISFQLRRGGALGLVGPNGAGKSTLLRVISGLIKPDAGTIRVRGRVAPLIALDAGFNPILTGRENLYVNMSILGLSNTQIQARFEDVVNFAEIEDAIDAPVQTYSSGMAARLGFASAIHTEPDILLIDEVLAVGDIKFRMKCYRRLAELRERGTSFILVSHNPQSILAICDMAVYLMKGGLVAIGDTNSIMNKYETDLFLTDDVKLESVLHLPEKKSGEGSGINIISICFKNDQGQILQVLDSGEPAYLCVKCECPKQIDNVNLSIIIRGLNTEYDSILSLSSLNDGYSLKVSPGIPEIQLQMPCCCLKPNSYSMKISLSDGPFHMLDAVEAFKFKVVGKKSMANCLFYQPRVWRVCQTTGAIY